MNVIPKPSRSTRQPASPPPFTLDGKLAKNQPAASTRQACRKDTINSTNVIDVLADVKGPARTEPNEMLVFEWSS